MCPDVPPRARRAVESSVLRALEGADRPAGSSWNSSRATAPKERDRDAPDGQVLDLRATPSRPAYYGIFDPSRPASSRSIDWIDGSFRAARAERRGHFPIRRAGRRARRLARACCSIEEAPWLRWWDDRRQPRSRIGRRTAVEDGPLRRGREPLAGRGRNRRRADGGDRRRAEARDSPRELRPSPRAPRPGHRPRRGRRFGLTVRRRLAPRRRGRPSDLGIRPPHRSWRSPRRCDPTTTPSSASAAETFDLPGPVFEFGSFQVEGQEELLRPPRLLRRQALRRLRLPRGAGRRSRRGRDRDRPGPRLGRHRPLHRDVRARLTRSSDAFDEVFRVLRPGGVFILTSPFHFRIHGYPDDYWRITPSLPAADDGPVRRPGRRLPGAGIDVPAHGHGAGRSRRPAPADFARRADRMIAAYQRLARRGRGRDSRCGRSSAAPWASSTDPRASERQWPSTTTARFHDRRIPRRPGGRRPESSNG